MTLPIDPPVDLLVVVLIETECIWYATGRADPATAAARQREWAALFMVYVIKPVFYN
jgi:hypothetical protein